MFYPRKAHSFKGELAQWPEVLEAFIIRHRIDAVLLFGDCRPVHACVRSMTERLGCAFGVFEEGYLRPDHITFEPMGVNGHSHFEKRLAIWLKQRAQQEARATAFSSEWTDDGVMEESPGIHSGIRPCGACCISLLLGWGSGSGITPCITEA